MSQSPTMNGESEAMRRATENYLVRHWVRELSQFGLSQRQHLMLIYLVAQELENVEHMRTLTRTVRDLGGEDLFLIGRPERDEEVSDGKTNV